MVEVIIIGNSKADRVFLKLLLEKRDLSGQILEFGSYLEAVQHLDTRNMASTDSVVTVFCDKIMGADDGENMLKNLSIRFPQLKLFNILTLGLYMNISNENHPAHIDAIFEKKLTFDAYEQELDQLIQRIKEQLSVRSWCQEN